ncbi:unnamed protein product [Rangifer tarandus platyrhynchus]|uniref:Uncharacterized protein n=1 Tax=Rangifer tarandus platyrhynchus TaxID=3082113 RepID=A0AC59YW32_RANTA
MQAVWGLYLAQRAQEESSIKVAERASRARGGRDAVAGHSTEEVREPALEVSWPLEWTEQRQPLRAAFWGTSRAILTEADSRGGALLGSREHLSIGPRKPTPSLHRLVFQSQALPGTGGRRDGAQAHGSHMRPPPKPKPPLRSSPRAPRTCLPPRGQGALSYSPLANTLLQRVLRPSVAVRFDLFQFPKQAPPFCLQAQAA